MSLNPVPRPGRLEGLKSRFGPLGDRNFLGGIVLATLGPQPLHRSREGANVREVHCGEGISGTVGRQAMVH